LGIYIEIITKITSLLHMHIERSQLVYIYTRQMTRSAYSYKQKMTTAELLNNLLLFNAHI